MKNQQKQYEKRAEWLRQYKESHPCADCGQSFPAVCMDFDHTEDNKQRNIASMITSYSWERLLAEIAKCELVCANCHRLRTWRRKKGLADGREPATLSDRTTLVDGVQSGGVSRNADGVERSAIPA